MPRVFPDPRIVIERPKPHPQKIFTFDVGVKVRTESPGGIRLLSEFANPALPLSLQLSRRGPKQTGGYVRIEPFDIEVARRTMRVQKMLFDFSTFDRGVLPVDGTLRVEQTNYTVYIDVKGDVRSPNVELSSEPYLPREDIISVLLYDQTTDQLVSADATTAGSFDAALANRAIGLAGLWAFAGTPIRSFYYNPMTKVYTATVALGNDVSLAIGTNWEEATHFEMRKRLYQRWFLAAVWDPNSSQEDDAAKLVLQWENRF